MKVRNKVRELCGGLRERRVDLTLVWSQAVTEELVFVLCSSQALVFFCDIMMTTRVGNE